MNGSMNDDALHPSLRHFLELARRGAGAGASGGEYRCQALAQALLENVSGIDGKAYEGMCLFGGVASVDYPRARLLLRGIDE